MTIYRKAELFEEILHRILLASEDDPAELAEALENQGLTEEEIIAQLNTWGYDGEAAWEAYEEW